MSSALRACDERLLVLARTRGHTPVVERCVARFSSLGEHAAVWLALGLAGSLIDKPHAQRWRRAMAVVGGTYALNTAIKLAVRRRRPTLDGLPALTATPTRLSFPSAHSATAVAGAVLYSRLGAPPQPLAVLAALLGYSRLYLGVHYPSDILAGALLGALVAGAAGLGDEADGDRRGGGAPA